MKIPQFALLNSEPFVLQGIGTLKSPTLREIAPNHMQNFMAYSLIANVLFAKKTEIISIAQALGNHNLYHTLKQVDIANATKYNLIVCSQDLRNALCAALPLFFCNQISYSDPLGFIICSEDGKQIVGNINNDNYQLIEDLLKQLLHCASEYSDTQLQYASDKAEALWEQTTKYAEKEKSDINAKDYEIGNIISKLCTCGIGYTVFNIYNLTVYQLYDQFSAYMQNRISQLSENAYAHNGGEDFDFNSWLRK